jgi:hypothetical protein
MIASSNAVRFVEHQPNLNEAPPNSAAYVVDSFEARHRLLAESERIIAVMEVPAELDLLSRAKDYIRRLGE